MLRHPHRSTGGVPARRSQLPTSRHAILPLIVTAVLLAGPAVPAHASAPTPPVGTAALTRTAGTAPSPDADSDGSWNINEAHGPSRTISFTTDEGTWISLDVHPDGKKIVFSLLGDLYLLDLPSGDGSAPPSRARRLTSGPAMDLEPRFSPDGKWIAFATDRGGTENLWICDLEGKNARQVSTDEAVGVNGPAWSPDGDWLIGRKRITSQSSIGLVELWMWHLKGGDGIRITKGEEQPDAADPVFSPDGRFIYFSARDNRFSYETNVYSGLWQIRRYDRKTAQSILLTAEDGGAATPALSPDGRTMSFVRRIRAKTVLQLMDLESGRIRTLAEGLERDNEEGFAAHGVFPGYGWTPDGAAVIATAGGKIWRWDVADGRKTAIPFVADVEQTVADALRFPHPLGGDTLRARIIRWPVESPDGRRLVYSAVGHLYVSELTPDPATGAPHASTPRRLTTFDALEYAPAFSPDGRWVTFVTWTDADEGAVWKIRMPDEAAGGAGSGTADGSPFPLSSSAATRLTDVPGQYANPSFSPDGSKVVFLRGSGVTFREADLSDELWHEIRWVPSGGGESRYVIGTANRGANRRMARPMFSADGERVYYVEDEDAEKPGDPPHTLLVSVKLDGTDRQAALNIGLSEEAVVSPDGQWVVFNDLHNAYVTALPGLGHKTVDVALEGAALPLAQLTDEGGEWVGWADGGRTITWIFGPYYHRLALSDAFPAPETSDIGAGPEDGKAAGGAAAKKAAKSGSDRSDSRRKGGTGTGRDGTAGGGGAGEDGEAKKKELPKSETIEIDLELPRDRPSGSTLYTGARVVTMRGDEVIENGAILVRDDRIETVGPAASLRAPEGARVVDVSGRTIIPGLFDEHAHLHYSALDIIPERPWRYLANLAYGVTSTHDPSAATQEVFSQSEMVEAGLMTGPRIFSTGFILYGADIPDKAPVNSLDDARHHIRRMKSLGAFTVKSYTQPRRIQRQWIIEAAREEGIMVVPEGAGDLELNISQILDGHTTVEHALMQTPLYRDVTTLFGRSGTSYTPTLLVAYGGLSGEHWYYQHYDVWKDERLARFTPRGVIDRRSRVRPVMATDEDWHHIDVAASAKRVMDAGGRVCMGGHGQLQGLGPHWEMWTFVQGGMTPMQALRASTLNPAVTLGLDGDLGSIEPGKLADFVVLEKNPLEKIENSETVELVVKNGRAYTPDELALPRPAGDTW